MTHARERVIRYDVTTWWRFDAPVEAVWDAIVDAENWPVWWSGIEEVVTLAPGDGSGIGARRRCTCRGLLPFRLTIVTCVTRVEPLSLIEGRVSGELEGVGRCHLVRDARFTTVRYEWQVRTVRRWMNRLGPLAKPIFRWNHVAMMHAGGVGLARHLDSRAVPWTGGSA
ncbi:SRPBCC family protein [Aromatoleum buckelii]|uniref:Polyketide cyclase n=1 Tax=Aromatoleum buckelii TaxID=200254 RepID=A0ABX1MW27_9RHOO|nr:SRPBCC family protein [Aromatoleum buckelii]MCK0511004.1 SRPBCC family protein [Aromatoleum buckelii]